MTLRYSGFVTVDDPHAPMTGDPRQVRIGHAPVLHPEDPWGGNEATIRPPFGGVLTGLISTRASRVCIDPA